MYCYECGTKLIPLAFLDPGSNDLDTFAPYPSHSFCRSCDIIWRAWTSGNIQDVTDDVDDALEVWRKSFASDKCSSSEE